MREAVRDSGRLQHMLSAMTNIFEFCEGRDLNSIESDKMLYFAIVKNLEIVGEAVYMLTQEFKDSHPQTPWDDIEGMRHVLVHGYYQILPSEIISVVRKDIPVLYGQVKTYLGIV